MNNPFTIRHMIMNPEQFIGREYQITDILNRIQNGDSVSVVGDRRIGKSSLLYHIFQTGNQRTGIDNLEFIYLDMTDPRHNTPTKFCKCLIKKFIPDKIGSDDSLGTLADAIESYSQSNKKPIILLDEFEKITEQSDNFTNSFFEALRSLANQGMVGFITATQHSLSSLWRQEQLTSNFYNIFYTLELGEFEVSDIVDEPQEFIDRLWNRDLNPTEKEIEFLYSYRSVQPIIMQVISYWIFENRIRSYSELMLKDEIAKEIEGFFPTQADRIRKWIRKDFSRHLNNASTTAEKLGIILKAFSPLSLSLAQK